MKENSGKFEHMSNHDVNRRTPTNTHKGCIHRPYINHRSQSKPPRNGLTKSHPYTPSFSPSYNLHSSYLLPLTNSSHCKVIKDYHNGTDASVHTTDWDISGVGENGVLDVTKLGLPQLSMRVRVGRNLAAFNLPGLMDQAERIKFEKTLMPAFEKIKEVMGGAVYSLSPDWGEGEVNPNLIDDAKYQELVKAHVMFKDMDADTYV